MKDKSGGWILLVVAGLSAVVVGWWPDESNAFAPAFVTTSPAGEACDAVRLRIFAKLQVAADVAAGRRSLLEAAALFRELNRLPPESPDLSPEILDQFAAAPRPPARSAEERLCWQVVAWVRSVTEADGIPGQEAVARLRAEIQELRTRGAIRLPAAQALPPVRELLARARDTLPASERKPEPNRPSDDGEDG